MLAFLPPRPVRCEASGPFRHARSRDQRESFQVRVFLHPVVAAILLMPTSLMPAKLPADFMRVGWRPVQGDFMPEPLADLLPVWFA